MRHTESTGAAPWRSITMLTVGSFAVGTGLFALSGVLPQAAKDLHTSTSVVGQAVTVFAVVYAVSAPLLAVLTGRFALKPVLLIALVLLVAGNLLTALAPDVVVLLLSRVLAALGAAAYTPAALGAAAALAGPARSGAALALVQGGLNAALAVGVPIGAAVSTTLSWRAAPGVVAVLGVIAIGGLAIGSGPLPRARAVGTAALGALLRRGPVLLVLGVTVLSVGASISAYTYVAEVLGSTVDARGALLLVLLVGYGVGAFAGTIAAGPLTDRLGARRVLLVALGAQAVVLVLVAVAHVPAFALVAVVLWGGTTTASTPPQQVRLIERAPDTPTVAVSLNSSAIYVGQGAGAVIGGVVLGAGLSAGTLPLFAAVLAAVGVLVTCVRAPDRAAAPARAGRPQQH